MIYPESSNLCSAAGYWLQFEDKKTTFLFQRDILLTLLSITLLLLIYLNDVTHLRRA